MILTVFQAGKGDCLLLTSADDRRVLVDGGMRPDYRRHVAPALGELRAAKKKLDLVYVSHIDRDHISGVLQLMQDETAWRVHKFQQQTGNKGFPEPERPRPPEVLDLWHNAFHALVPDNAGEIEDLLAAKAASLELSDQPLAAREHRELATSVAEGIELSRRSAADQLGIPVNQHFGGKLALVRKGAKPVRLGSLELTVIGPFREELSTLRTEWDNWLQLEKSKQQLARLERRLQRTADQLASAELELPVLATDELGEKSRVTASNLASLMLLVEEGGKTILLTGDGHHSHILKGLEHAGRLDSEGRIHVDVLKVQHHGGEHNLDPDFARRVTADRYLFCANGEHQNPDVRIIAAIVDSRLGPPSKRSTHPRAAGSFEFLFNSSPAVTRGDVAHMELVAQRTLSACAASGGRMTCSFLQDSSFEIALD